MPSDEILLLCAALYFKKEKNKTCVGGESQTRDTSGYQLQCEMYIWRLLQVILVFLQTSLHVKAQLTLKKKYRIYKQVSLPL